MVETIFIHTVLKKLEKYFLRKNNFALSGKTFDLILFIPSERFISDTKYSLIISSKILDHYNQKDLIKEILTDFKENLNFDDYNVISRLNVINSDDSIVKNLNNMFAFREEIFELNQIPIGGINIDFAYLVKSLVLDKLIVGSAVTLEIKSDNGFERINCGIIKIDNNFDLVYYTGKGLREIFGNSGNIDLKDHSENYLIEQEYISKINIENILKIY